MAESVVNINGNLYRYEYVDGATVYRGPVGDAPALEEAEFLKAMMVSDEGLSSLLMGIDNLAEAEVFEQFREGKPAAPDLRESIEQQKVWVGVVEAFIEERYPDKYPNEVYEILEDKNYHTINEYLIRTGRFEDMSEFKHSLNSLKRAETEGYPYRLQLYFVKYKPAWFKKAKA